MTVDESDANVTFVCDACDAFLKKGIGLKKIYVKYSPQIGQNYLVVEQKSFGKQWFWWSPGLHEIVESRWFDSRLLRGVSAMSRFLLSKPYFKQA